ncbi:VOC family protein [Novosphingobium sp. Rr 2-17]|uniref:VOC family protein n=1 Tax=Novosphingobium sp. Rr 2-17 TaxID=555793 RepID=UPI0002D2BA91|nr:VOC family protein [Novosphingobium sp. Rr 2-17]
MSVIEETNREELLSVPCVRPTQIAHIVLQTTRFAQMRAFYITLLNAEVPFEDKDACFLRYDEEHHRMVIVNTPDYGPVNRRASGMHHFTFTYATLGELLGNYERLTKVGIEPMWSINHGFTTSMYYYDPDGNILETQFDNMTSEEADAFMRGPYFSINPIGVDFDPALLLERYRQGVLLSELVQFKSAPCDPNAPQTRPDDVPEYDAAGALL